MKLPHVQSVDVVRNGIVVTYDDASCAFYHESLLQLHLQDESADTSRGKQTKLASRGRKGSERLAGQPVRRKLSSLSPSPAGKL